MEIGWNTQVTVSNHFFIFGKHQLTRNQATFSSPERCPEVHLEERARRASRNSLPIFLQFFSPIFLHGFTCFHLGMTSPGMPPMPPMPSAEVHAAAALPAHSPWDLAGCGKGRRGAPGYRVPVIMVSTVTREIYQWWHGHSINMHYNGDQEMLMI